MLGLVAIAGVLSYALFVALGGPWWRRRVFRSLRPGDSLEARFAAQVLPALPPGSRDQQRSTRLDGALEIMALELEKLRSIAEDLHAVWLQARFASSLSAGGWSNQALDRHARFERMAVETLARARSEMEGLDPGTRDRMERHLGSLDDAFDALTTDLLGKIELGEAIEARRRPRPADLDRALERIGMLRRVLRNREGTPYR
jgi:hypothetical protein